MDKPKNITQELYNLCNLNCAICRGHLHTFSTLKYANPEDNKLFGLVSGNLQRHLKSGKHRQLDGSPIWK